MTGRLKSIRNTPKAYSSRGVTKRKMGDYEGAIADHDWAIGISPQYAAYNNRGVTKRKMGDYTGAIADYSRAIGINPQYAKAYKNRGIAKRKIGDYKGAIADFDQALKISPEYALAYSNRGIAKSEMGDYKGAIADYGRALTIDPGHKKAIHNRAVTLAMQESQRDGKQVEAKLRAQQERFDREMQDQLEFQQAKFDREMQNKLQSQQANLDSQFQADYQAAKDIANALEYDKNFKDYDKKAERRGLWIWVLSFVLAVAAVVVFGGIAYLAFEQWQECEKPCTTEGISAFSLLPFMLMGTLLLSPLVWVIRMLNRDKHKYWALREDALASLTLARIIKSNPTLRKKLSERLFDHHNKRGNASLMVDWNRSSTDGNNPIIAQDIAKEVINFLKLGNR